MGNPLESLEAQVRLCRALLAAAVELRARVGSPLAGPVLDRRSRITAELVRLRDRHRAEPPIPERDAEAAARLTLEIRELVARIMAVDGQTLEATESEREELLAELERRAARAQKAGGGDAVNPERRAA
ncbi:MAG TPA: hypothetical protein VHF22_01605 [Planctomycetota bacterium]|nr:hypothetical protein [Planctomycetota bacterium]